MKNNKIIYLILAIMPFILLAPFTFKYLDIGNDFELYYYVYKKYIFELLKLGHIPLWSPAEGSGYSLVFNPLTQFFYLPSWVLYLFCLFIGELSKYSFLIYTISAISIFNIGLYKYLKTFNINFKIILVTILITSLSLKLTELLRFPNALHAFSWFPWILFGMNSILLNDNYKKSFLIILFSSVMILTAGYPYYIFYGFLLFFLYFFFLIILPNKEIIFSKNKNNLLSGKRFFIFLSIPSILSLIITAPIILKISQLMKITRGRNTSEITFSYSGSSNLYDQIGSWIYPPISFAEGWFYFGAGSFFLFFIVFFFVIFFKKYLIKDDLTLRYFSYFFIFLLLTNYQFANPQDSLIFKYIWKYIEPIQNFRFWVRINIILVPIISLLIALSLKKFIFFINNYSKLYVKKINLLIITIFVTIFSFQIYLIYFSDYKNHYWETWQLKRILMAEENLPFLLSYFAGLYKGIIHSIFYLISFIFLFLVINNSFILNFFKKRNFLFLYSIFFICLVELFFLTNIQWSIPNNYYESGKSKVELNKNYNSPNDFALNDLNNAFLSSRVSIEKSGNNNYEGNTYYRNNKRFNINYINNWGNENHSLLFDQYFNRNGNFKNSLNFDEINHIKYFFGMDDFAKKIFYSNQKNHKDIISFVKKSKTDEKNNNFSYDLIYYNGDKLVINITTDQDGWISFIDTWDSNWKVFVNKKEKNLDKLFEAYKSVRVNSGRSTIEFSYRPFNWIFN